MMLIPGYDLDKAAQVVAYFALKSGGAINVLKLSKLVYLAEREAMRLYDEPMLYDQLCSMPDGPVASVTLNFMNGENADSRWSHFVGPRNGFVIPVANQDVGFKELDRLSRADLEILESLWGRFGDWDRYKLRDWTHLPANIPEWKDPQGSSIPIRHAEVFLRLEKDNPEELERDIQEVRELSKALNAVE
jgi:uncharacterized phage-associated protein